MKINVKTFKFNPKRKYPYLGIHENGEIVLFTSPRIGVLLRERLGGKPFFKLGSACNSWVEDEFSVFRRVLELSND
jgi:hypothetical protein